MGLLSYVVRFVLDDYNSKIVVIKCQIKVFMFQMQTGAYIHSRNNTQESAGRIYDSSSGKAEASWFTNLEISKYSCL